MTGHFGGAESCDVRVRGMGHIRGLPAFHVMFCGPRNHESLPYTIDRHGYVRYANWRLYGERALVGQPAIVWRCGDNVLVEHQDIPLTQFTVDVVADTRLIRPVKEARLFETPFESPQPFLPDLGDVAWLLAVRMRRSVRCRQRGVTGTQERLFPLATDAS